MSTIRLAIDVESGDFGSRILLAGILEARLLCDIPFIPFLCGNRERIRQTLDDIDPDGLIGTFETIDCTDFCDPGDQRANVWKKQANASIIRCVTLQKEHLVDASISAGDTAILLGAALFILGRSEGALRPALAAFLPTVKKKPVLMLDVGANLNCRPEHLSSFALMANSYVSRYLSLKNPEVALLSVGKEAVKGTRLISETGQLLNTLDLNYCGFIEGNDILAGKADIVVCDGFCGNVLLKAFESFHKLAKSVFGDQVQQDGTFKKNITALDPDNYGAVPFLGINGTVLKAHGGSSSRAIANAIVAAIKTVQRNAVEAANLKGNY